MSWYNITISNCSFTCSGNCAKFLVDLGLDIVILYERIYEIYGDILGAVNSFDVKAYEMGKLLVIRQFQCLFYS